MKPIDIFAVIVGVSITLFVIWLAGEVGVTQGWKQ